MTPIRVISGIALILGVGSGAVFIFGPAPARIAGHYEEVGGPGRLEFRRDRVYITSLLGMTFAAEYEVDGDRVIVKDGGGSRVYTMHGDTLDGGMGTTFIKR